MDSCSYSDIFCIVESVQINSSANLPRELHVRSPDRLLVTCAQTSHRHHTFDTTNPDRPFPSSNGLLQGPAAHRMAPVPSRPSHKPWNRNHLRTAPQPRSDPSGTHRVRPVSSPSGTSDPPLCSGSSEAGVGARTRGAGSAGGAETRGARGGAGAATQPAWPRGGIS